MSREWQTRWSLPRALFPRWPASGTLAPAAQMAGAAAAGGCAAFPSALSPAGSASCPRAQRPRQTGSDVLSPWKQTELWGIRDEKLMQPRTHATPPPPPPNRS